MAILLFMLNVCPKCGTWTQEAQIIEPDHNPKQLSWRKCVGCGDLFPFKKLPIFFLTGASGAGKTTIGQALFQMNSLDVVPIESDILWGSITASEQDDYRQYRETWLRLCKNFNHCGKPALLVGTVIPSQIEECIERRYFSATHYLVLVRSEREIVESLKSRPDWRESSGDEFITRHLEFNRWLIDHADQTTPSMHLIDISGKTIQESCRLVLDTIGRLRE